MQTRGRLAPLKQKAPRERERERALAVMEPDDDAPPASTYERARASLIPPTEGTLDAWARADQAVPETETAPWPNLADLGTVWTDREAENADFYRRLSSGAAGDMLKSILGTDYEQDPTTVPEMEGGRGDRRALGVPGGRFHAIYGALLTDVSWRSVAQYRLWSALRSTLRILDLHGITFNDRAGPETLLGKGEVKWPHLTHLSLTELGLGRRALADDTVSAVLRSLYGMPKLRYFDLQLVHAPEQPVNTATLTHPARVRELLAATHRWWKYWAFQDLRVLRLRNLHWRRFPTALVLGTMPASGGGADADYLRDQGHPGLRQALGDGMPAPPATQPTAPQDAEFGLLPDYRKDVPAASDDWLDVWPHMTYLDLEGVRFDPATTPGSLSAFRGGCALWMERARLKSQEAWNTYAAYEDAVAFPFYDPLQSATDDLAEQWGLRPWRFLHSALVLGSDGVEFPSLQEIHDEAGVGTRAIDVAVALHALYVQSLMTHGRPLIQRGGDLAARSAQGASLLSLLAGVGPGGDAWGQLRRGLGAGRSIRDGRGLGIFFDLPNRATPIALDLMPAALLLRSLDRPTALTVRQRWPLAPTSRVIARRQRVTLPSRPLRMPTGRLVTHLVLKEVVLTPLSRRASERLAREVGWGTAGMQLMHRLLINLPRLTYLHLDGGGRMPKAQRDDVARFFTRPTDMLRLMVSGHKATRQWPLQDLALLRLHRMGLRNEMPWTVLPISVKLETLRGEDEHIASDVRYLRLRYSTERRRGHVWGREPGTGPFLSAMEIFPRLLHLDFAHNRLMDIYGGDDADDPGEDASDLRMRRVAWLGAWADRSIRAAEQTPRKKDWRGLGLKAFESMVATPFVAWTQEAADDAPPHLLSYATVDFRHNPLQLDKWPQRDIEALADVRRFMYTSHLSVNLEADDILDITAFLMSDTYEFLTAYPGAPEPEEDVFRLIDNNWGRGAWEAAFGVPMTRGFAFRVDGDEGAALLLQQLVALSTGSVTIATFFTSDADLPQYGMGLTAEEAYGRYGPSARRVTPEGARQSALRVYREYIRNAVVSDWIRHAQREGLADAIAVWTYDPGRPLRPMGGTGQAPLTPTRLMRIRNHLPSAARIRGGLVSEEDAVWTMRQLKVGPKRLRAAVAGTNDRSRFRTWRYALEMELAAQGASGQGEGHLLDAARSALRHLQKDRLYYHKLYLERYSKQSRGGLEPGAVGERDHVTVQLGDYDDGGDRRFVLEGPEGVREEYLWMDV